MAIQGTSKTSCRAVYEKFKDGTVKDISDDIPFEIPKGWAWARLSSVTEDVTSGSRDWARYYSSQGDAFLRMGNLSRESFNLRLDKIQRVSLPKNAEGVRTSLRPGDLLFSITAEIGMLGLIPNDFETAYINQHTARIRFMECERNRYLPFVMLSSYARRFYIDEVHGLKSSFRLDTIGRLLVPLPPLAEQKRIVAKIEKLMSLVEEYGKMEDTRIQLDADLPASLEKSILQEAIQGKLVPQDPNDEPASELLKRVAAERKALAKAGKLKRDKGESVIFRGSDRLAYETRDGETVCIQDEIPFEIPDSWEWVRLGNVSNYGQCTSVDTSDIRPSTWSLDLEEIEKGTGRLLVRKTVAEKKSKSSKHVFAKGTLLYSKLRTYLNKVLVADMDGVCTSEIVPVELQGGICAEYVRHVLMSPHFLEYTASKGYGIKMPRVGTDDMKQSLIPLPPLDEQKRIVKRVEGLKAKTRTLTTF